MTMHPVATRAQWLQQRMALLTEEKALTRQSDTVARQRQALPWVPVDKDYAFATEHGAAALADLFQGRSQLLVYHFMYGPDYAAGCPSCSSIADGFDAMIPHLNHHDVSLAAVSLAPLQSLLAYRQRMGWHFPWASSADSDFNADFSVSFTDQQQREGLSYNYQQEAPTPASSAPLAGDDDAIDSSDLCARMAGTSTTEYARQRPGMSAFVRKGDAIYHTYSTYARGLDGLWNMYQWLDRAPLGRNEAGGYWMRRHDEYPQS